MSRASAQDAAALLSAEGYLQRLGGAEAPAPAQRDALILVGRKLLLDLLMLLGAKVRLHRLCTAGKAASEASR